jgi:hypothetical protein
MRVAIFRNHPTSHERLVRAFAAQRVHLHDICSTDRLGRGFIELATERTVDLEIDQVPLSEFALVVFLGFPRVAGHGLMSSDTHRFAVMEWNSWLWSALSLQARNVLGLPADSGPTPAGRYGARRLLHDAGWRCVSAQNSLALEPVPLTPPRSVGQFEVVFTRKRWVFVENDLVTFECNGRFEELCWRTWSLLLSHRQACSMLRFDVEGDQFEAHALWHALPDTASDQLAHDVAIDALY